MKDVSAHQVSDWASQSRPSRPEAFYGRDLVATDEKGLALKGLRYRWRGTAACASTTIEEGISRCQDSAGNDGSFRRLESRMHSLPTVARRRLDRFEVA